MRSAPRCPAWADVALARIDRVSPRGGLRGCCVVWTRRSSERGRGTRTRSAARKKVRAPMRWRWRWRWRCACMACVTAVSAADSAARSWSGCSATARCEGLCLYTTCPRSVRKIKCRFAIVSTAFSTLERCQRVGEFRFFQFHDHVVCGVRALATLRTGVCGLALGAALRSRLRVR